MFNLAGCNKAAGCGCRFDIVLGHFRQGSVRVGLNDRLAVGATIAEVGNSGATNEPHLHIHAQTPGTAEAPFSGAPIPVRLDGRFWVRNDRFEIPGDR